MALRQPTKEELAKVKSQPVNPNLPKTPGIQMVPNPRDKVTTPAQNASINVPKTVQTPSIVTPTSSSQLKSLTQQEAQTIQGKRDANRSQNYTNPALMSNPRDQQTVSGGGVQQDRLVGGNMPAIPLSTSATNVPTVTDTGAIPTGQSAMTPETGAQSPTSAPVPGQAPTGQEGATGAPTGAQEGVAGAGAPMTQQEQLYQGMQEGAQGFLEAGQEGIMGLRDAKDNARALQLQQTLGSTNAVDMLKAIGKDLNDLSLQELEQLAVSQGLDIREEDKQRIKQEGASAIESMGYERGDRLAEVDYQKAQLERTLGRAMTEQEKFNAQQDAKMRRLANAFGFGKDLGANVQTMRVAQEGQQALNDLAADFAGRGGLLANQADAIQRAYYSGVREVESQTNGLIEAKFAQIQNMVSDLIKQGVTDEEDLRKATFDLNKEYIGLYNDANKALAEYLTDAQKTAFDQMYKAMEFQQTEDKNLTDQTGFLYQNGQPVLDATGNPISNAEMLRFMTTEQRQMYALEQDQKQFESRLGFDMTKQQFTEMMETARFSQDAEQFNANYGLNLSKFEFDQLKDAADREMTMADKGLTYGGGNVDVSTKTSSFNPSGSKYGVSSVPGGIQVNAPLIGGQRDANGDIYGAKLDSKRRQCGMFVNDAIGIPSYFGNTLASKQQRITSQTPVPGSAVVINEGDPSIGHVALVTKVHPDGRITIAESNYDNKESYREKTYGSLEEFKQKRRVLGFTGGLQQNKSVTKTGGATTGSTAKINAESVISGVANISDFKQEDRPEVLKILSERKAQLLKSGNLRDALSASAGGKALTEKIANDLSNIDIAATDLDSLSARLDATITDPILGSARKNIPYDAKAKEIAAIINSSVPNIARGVFGEVGVLTDADIRRYEAVLGGISETADVNDLIEKVLRDKLKRSAEAKLKSYAGSYDVSQYGYLLDRVGMPDTRVTGEQLGKAGQGALKAADTLAQASPLYNAGKTLFNMFNK